MFKILGSQFKGWVVSITLVLSALLLVPAPTMAATAVSLDSSNSSVNVATVYKVDKAAQEKMLSNVLKSTQADLPAAKGFIIRTGNGCQPNDARCAPDDSRTPMGSNVSQHRQVHDRAISSVEKSGRF